MPHTLTAQVTDLVYLLVGLFALWKGQVYERWVAIVLLIACFAVPLAQDHIHYADPRGQLYWVDGPLLVILLALALRSGSLLLVVVAAFQLLCVMTEAVHDYAHAVIRPLTYVVLLVLWSWGAVLTLLAATVLAMRRRARSG